MNELEKVQLEQERIKLARMQRQEAAIQGAGRGAAAAGRGARFAVGFAGLFVIWVLVGAALVTAIALALPLLRRSQELSYMEQVGAFLGGTPFTLPLLLLFCGGWAFFIVRSAFRGR